MSVATSLTSARGGIIDLFRRVNIAPVVWIIAAISFAFHIVIGNNYGYFRDELYYIAMSQHPAFGYVDVPPLVPLIADIPRFLAGDALWSLHVISALVCAATIILTGLMARLLGGSSWAQGVAALGAATNLTLLALGAEYSYDVFDAFWWTLAAVVLIRLLRDERPQRWLEFGVVAGLALLTKETILFWGFALVAGLLLTKQRRLLFTRWTLFGGLIAFALFLPYLLWNAANDWATFQYWSGYSQNHSSPGTPLDFLTNQILTTNPLLTVLWGAGLWFYLFSQRGARYRVFGWAYLILFALFAALQAKSYFLAPAYTPLYAGGALALVGAWQARWRRGLVIAYLALLTLESLFLAPAATPTLPPSVYGHIYGTASSGGSQQVSGDANGLPQTLADRFGWERQVALIARVYHSLPPDQQRVACIFASNYGEASALVEFGPTYHLPQPISGHNAFYLWGPGNCTGQVLITINVQSQVMSQEYGSVVLAARTSCANCVDFENNAPILIARDPKFTVPFAKLWPQVKMYE